MKQRAFSLLGLLGILIITGCGSNNTAVTPPPPVNSNPFQFGYCPPGQEWQCGWGGYSDGMVFATGVGTFYGDEFNLSPGQIPSGYTADVGFNGYTIVQNGNVLTLSGSATWGKFDDSDFWDWDLLFGWYDNDYCDDIKPAEVAISYGGQPAFVMPSGSQPVATPYPSGVYYGYNPASKPSGVSSSDLCLNLNNLSLFVY